MAVTDMPTMGQEAGSASTTSRRKGEKLAQTTKTTAMRARDALQDSARKSAEAARTQAAAASRKVSELTQARPLASVSTAVGVGLLAGALIGLSVGYALANRDSD